MNIIKIMKSGIQSNNRNVVNYYINNYISISSYYYAFLKSSDNHKSTDIWVYKPDKIFYFHIDIKDSNRLSISTNYMGKSGTYLDFRDISDVPSAVIRIIKEKLDTMVPMRGYL